MTDSQKISWWCELYQYLKKGMNLLITLKITLLPIFLCVISRLYFWSQTKYPSRWQNTCCNSSERSVIRDLGLVFFTQLIVTKMLILNSTCELIFKYKCLFQFIMKECWYNYGFGWQRADYCKITMICFCNYHV